MDSVDYIFVAIVLSSVLVGVLRGFVREALSLLTWILAFFLALRLGPQLATHLRAYIAAGPLRTAAADAAVFFGILLAGALVMFLVTLALRGSALEPADRTLGAGFGLLRGVFIVVAAVMLGGMTQLQQSQAWRRSLLVPQMQPLAKGLHALIPAHWLVYLQQPPAVPAAVAPKSGK
ncbi:MAG: CvpA family protein [Nevskia sp.]|nr:CvpA family protein [Nevskia sp.]